MKNQKKKKKNNTGKWPNLPLLTQGAVDIP